jgi:hypothetical protein
VIGVLSEKVSRHPYCVIEEEPFSDPLSDGSMCPPQSGPLRTNPVVREAPYSPQKQTTARFEQSLSPFPGLTSAQVKKLNKQFENPKQKLI